MRDFENRFALLVTLCLLIFGATTSTHAQTRLLDYLPSGNSLYVWTDDSQQLFATFDKVQLPSLEQLTEAFQIPDDWTESRKEFQQPSIDAYEPTIVALEELWDKPLFDGEAVLVRRNIEHGSHTIIVLEAPASTADYAAAIESLNALYDPLTKSERKRLLDAQLATGEGEVPVEGDSSGESAINSMGQLPGYWAHDGSRFFWAKGKDELAEAMEWFVKDRESIRNRLTEDRTFETVFRSISTASRRQAVVRFYIPPEGKNFLLRLGHTYQAQGFSPFYTPAWLDLSQDIRAVGGCFFLREDEPEQSSLGQLQLEGFALVSQPRGPVWSAFRELDFDSLQLPAVPRSLRLISAFGLDGEELANSLPKMVERFERLPQKLRKWEVKIPISIDDDGQISYSEKTNNTPSPDDFQLVEDIIRSTDEVVFLSSSRSARFNSDPNPDQDSFLFAHSREDQQALQQALMEYLEGQKVLASGVSSTPSNSRPKMSATGEYARSQKLGGELVVWSLQKDYRDEIQSAFAEAIDSNIEWQVKRLEKLRADGDSQAEVFAEQIPAFVELLEAQKIHFDRQHNSSWVSFGNWALLHDVDPDVANYFEDPRSAEVDSVAQLSQFTEDVQALQSLAQLERNPVAIISLTSQYIGVASRVLDADHPESLADGYFDSLNKPSQANTNRMASAIQARRWKGLHSMILTSFDRIGLSFYNSSKGVTFRGATFSKPDDQP